MEKRLRKIKELVQQKTADVRIGKRGLTESVINEIKRRLKAKGVIKVKMLKSSLEITGLSRGEFAKKIAEAVDAQLLEVRGRTLSLYREEENVKK